MKCMHRHYLIYITIDILPVSISRARAREPGYEASMVWCSMYDIKGHAHIHYYCQHNTIFNLTAALTCNGWYTYNTVSLKLEALLWRLELS